MSLNTAGEFCMETSMYLKTAAKLIQLSNRPQPRQKMAEALAHANEMRKNVVYPGRCFWEKVADVLSYNLMKEKEKE